MRCQQGGPFCKIRPSPDLRKISGAAFDQTARLDYASPGEGVTPGVYVTWVAGAREELPGPL
jgi:hypothetical protein